MRKLPKIILYQNSGAVQHDFYNNVTLLLKDFFKFKRFKVINPGLVVLPCLFLNAFLIAGLLLALVHYLVLFCYKIFISPIDQLMDMLRHESKDEWVTATVFFIGFPFVLCFIILGAFFAIIFFTLYLFMSTFLWIFSLGGITFHPFIFDGMYEEKDIEVSNNESIDEESRNYEVPRQENYDDSDDKQYYEDSMEEQTYVEDDTVGDSIEQVEYEENESPIEIQTVEEVIEPVETPSVTEEIPQSEVKPINMRKGPPPPVKRPMKFHPAPVVNNDETDISNEIIKEEE